jgi:hypothetical protein
MMRIDLPTPLASGQQFVFNISWNYNINNQRIFGGRTGYEYFPPTEIIFTKSPTGFREWLRITTFRLAAQTIFGSGRIHARIRRLSRPNHSAERSCRYGDRRFAKSGAGFNSRTSASV